MAQSPATPNPSQYQLRAKLEAMVLGDLLGPAAGLEEELTERPQSRYLVGVLAPSRSAAPVAKPVEEDEEDEDIQVIPDDLAEGQCVLRHIYG